MLFYLHCVCTGERPYLVLIERPQLVDGDVHYRLIRRGSSSALEPGPRDHVYASIVQNLKFYSLILADAFLKNDGQQKYKF